MLQSFVAVMLVTLMAVGSVVAQTTYSHTITVKTWSALGEQSLNGVNWTATGTATDGGYFGYDNTKGQQFGSGSKPFSALTLTTSEIAGTITSVKVNTSGANSVNATFKVKVGDTYFTSGEADHIAVTNTATDYTFTGSASGAVALEWAQTSSKALYIKSVEITYTPAAVAVATPTFTPAAGTYYTTQNVAIACETADAIIHYTLDGTAPTAQSPIYSTPIAVNTTTTIKAIAVKGADNSTVASATYTFPAATQLDNIAAFKTQTSTTELFKINSDVTVIFQTADKYHTFIQDSSAAIYVYGTMDKAYNAGDVIQGGLYGKYALYKEMNELKPVAGTPLAAGTPGTPVAPVVVTLADLIANYAQYEGRLVTVTGVTVATTEAFTFETTRSTGMNVSQNGSTIQIYNTFKSLDKTYYPNNTLNVTGLVIRYNNTVEIAPRNNDDITFAPAVLPYMVDFDQNVDPGLVLANGNNTDKWFIGQPQGFDNNKLFISSTNGVTNKYDVNTPSDVLAFRDIIIPEKGATLSFDSRTMGENGDLFKVYIYNGSFHMIFGEYDEPEWNHIEVPISPEYAGLATLVFHWLNNGDGQGEQSPIAIDNISIIEAACAQPIALNVTVNDANAVVTWTAADTTQNAWTLEYKLEDHNEWYSVNTTTPTATLSDLQGSSNYNVRVKANCGAESSEWTYGQFQVGCLNEVTTSVDTTITIGTGTDGFYYLFPGLYGWQYTAVVYEIAKPGTINDIAFYLNSSSSYTGSTMQVWVKAVDSDYGLVQTNTFANMVAGAQEIYNGAPNFSTAGWISFPISGGFAIPEGKKLMVLVRGVGCGTTGGCGKQAAYTTTSSNTVWYDRDDDNDPGQNNSAYAMSTNRPNIKININVPSVSCNDQLACAAPTAVTVTDVTDNSAVVTWSGNATDYSFEYKTGNADWTVVPVSDTTYTLTGLTQKTDYLVRVKAICGENNYSLYTEEVPFTTLSICPVVTDITTSNLSTTTTISWTPGGDENAWTLRFRPQGSTEWVYLHINGIPSTTFGGLLDQTDYEVEVMALCDPNDEENQSSWTSYAFTSGCAPFEMTYTEEFEGTQAPNCWTSEGFDFDGQSAIAEEAGWLMSPPINIPAEGNAYIVLDVQGAGSVLASYRGTALNRFESIYTIPAGITMQHIIIPVPEIYKDKAVNFMIVANGELEVAAAEFTQCAFVPAELTASNPTNNSVELSWTGINNNGWVVEYAVANNNGVWTSVNVEQTGDTVAYTLTGLDGSTTYNFRVRTVCTGGYTSNPSNIATITTRCNPVSEIPYERFSSYSNNTFDCWTNLYTGTYNSNGVSNTNTNKARLYNYYNRTLDSTDIDAFGDVYAILPAFDTTLNVLQINFTAETYMSSDEGAFELGLVTDINDPVHTFIPLASYVAPYSPAANYTYILNNVEENGYLAFRMAKGNNTRRVDLSNILVEYIPACQKPNSLVATPISETSMSLNWNIVGIQRNWDIRYMQTQFAFNPDAQGTLVTANERPRIINNLTYGETYTFYIRTNCGSNGQTSWVGPFTKKLELNYNLANAADITGCNGNIVFEPDTAGTNTLIVRPTSNDSWINLTGNVQLGSAMLKVYDGTAVDESKLLAIYTGSTMVDMTPLCANELTLKLENVGATTPVVNLAFTCETVPTCSAPTDLAYNELTNTLTWDASCWGTPESYYITVENAQGSTDPLTLTSTSTSVVIPVENLSNGTYYATVFPICNGQMGTGVWTEFERVACADPTNLAVNFTGNTAQLTWSGNAALGYEVGYRLHGAYTWNTDNVTTTSYTTPVLDDNVDYDFRVKAICNAADQSGYVITTGHVDCATEVPGIVEAQIGNGTNTIMYVPFMRYYYNSYSQQLFTQEELAEQGIESGMTITELSFNYYSTNATDKPIKLSLANTNVSSLSSFVSNNEFTEVFASAWVHFTNENNNWYTIQFTTPFVYTGGNLVLSTLMCYKDGDGNTSHFTYGSGNYFYCTPSSGKTRYCFNDYTSDAYQITFNANGMPMFNNSVQSGSTTSYRTNVIFGASGMVCQPVVSCPAPSNVAIVEKSENSVSFNWNSGGSEATWTVVYTLDNQEYSATANDTVYTITGLQGSTPYSIPVRVYANCDATHQSVGAGGTLNFTTPCPAITTFPWTEDFDARPSGNFTDPCWVNEHIEGSGTQIFKVYTYTIGDNSTHTLQLPDMYSGTMTKLVLPAMNLSNGNYQFTLDVLRNTSSSSYAGEGIRVFVSADGEIEGATELAFISRNYTTSDNHLIPAESASGWYTYELPISISGPCNIILRGESKYGSATYMDNFMVSAAPTCSNPVLHTFNSLTNTINWSNGTYGTPESYTIEYRESGAEAYTTLSTSVTDTFYTFATGVLTPMNTYDVRVKANCGTADGESIWSEYSFMVPAPPATLPYNYSFDNADENSSWVLVNGTQTNKWYIGTATGNGDNTALYISNNNGTSNAYTNTSASMVWAYRDFNFAVPGTYTFSFDWKCYGEGNSYNNYDYSYVYLGAIGDVTAGSSSISNVIQLPNSLNSNNYFNLKSTWTTAEYQLNLENPGIIRLYFYWNNDGSEGTNPPMAIDNISIQPPVPCSTPVTMGIHFDPDTTLSWTSGMNGTPESYTLQYREVGSEEITTVTVTDTFYRFHNLAEATTYEYQLQADCGQQDGLSEPTKWIQFTTPANCNVAFTMPFEEDFEASSPSLSCWTTIDADGDGYAWDYPTESWPPVHSGNSCARSASYINGIGALTPDNWIISPAIIIEPDAQLRFWLRGYDDNGYEAEKYSVYVATRNDTSAFLANPVSTGVTTNEYVQTIVDLSAYAGDTIYVAFRHHNVTDMYWLNLDDFSIITNPCAPIATFPWTENFEERESGNFSDPCWENEHTVSVSSRTDIFKVYTSENAGNSTHQLQLPDMQSGNMTQLTLPAMRIPDSNYQFVLDVYRSHYSSYKPEEGIRVYVSSNGEIDSATELAFIPRQYNASSDVIPAESTIGWYTYELPIAISGPCYIILRGESQYGTATYMDNFVVSAIPTCFVPKTVSVSEITYNSAEVSWTDPKHQQNFAVEYMAEGDTAWTTVAGDTTLKVALTGLEYSTNYVVRVKAVCGEGDESEYTDEVYFTTPCLGGNFYIVGTGTSYSSNNYTPYYYYGNNSYTEMLYTASEINQNGMISSIAFDCATIGSMTIDTLRIYVATTNKTSLSASTSNWTPMEEMTLVYEGTNVTVGTKTGWETYAFNTPVNYNGEDNLLVAVSKKGSSYNYSLKYNATYISGSVHYQTGSATPTSSGSTSSYRSNAQFMICPPDNDLAIESIEPIADACDLSDAKVVVKLRNNSYLNAVNGFTVNYTVNGAETPVTETVNATILPQETYVHTFATTPAFVDGSNNILVSVIYNGDEVEDNNTMALNDIRQVVPATVPYEQDFSNVVLGRDAWTQGAENNNPNLWKISGGMATFMDNDTVDAQNYFITHCIEIPAGQVQISYDYNALSSLAENLNVYMGTTQDISEMTLIGSHDNFTKAADDYTYNYLFDNAAAGVYYFAVEATSLKGNMGITFDNLSIVPMVDVTVTAGPNGTVTPQPGVVKVPYGGSLTINIIPDNMYHTAGVWVDSVRVMNEDPYNASFMMYTLDNITEPHTIDVQFKMEFHIFKYAYNYNSAYPEVGGYYVGDAVDTTNITSRRTVQFVADEHYTLHSLVVGTTPPASEGAIIDGDNVIADVTYDPATRTYTYVIDTLYVSNYYVQGCFKMDTVAINYTVLNGAGIFDGVTVVAGEEHNTWIDYSNDHTSTIQPAAGYYNMGVWVNGEYEGLLTEYEFNDVVETQYVVAQFGHKVTASISNFNNIEYLGSDEVRGTIEPADTMILSGTSCTVTGTVQDHFHLSNFFVNGTDMIANVNMNGNNFTFTIDSLIANTDIHAVVRIDTVAIIYTVEGGNGYVNGNAMNAVSSDTVYIDYGSDFMSQFAAATGYHLVNVTVNGVPYSEIPSWFTEHIREAQYINVTFALNEYDITTAAHGNGTVSEGMHVVYAPDHNYTFTATPAVGYHISQILRNNVALAIDNPEATFTDVIAPVLDNYDYVAYFTPNIYTITATAGENGTIDPYGLQSYEYGATPTFTVTANAGYQVDEVRVDSVLVTLTNGAYTFAPLTCNHTISVTFKPLNYTITATAGNGGSITPDDTVVVASGSAQTFVIAPATGYVIDDVTVDNVSVGAVTSYTFENVNANHTINATFSAINLTITATAGANGTITPSGVQTVAYGSTPTFTVTADTGYDIDEVRVDGQVVTLTNGTYTFAEVTTNHDIYASFKVKTFTITVTEPAHASITPNGVMTVNYGATPTFTITPALGYDVTAITVNGTNVISSAVATATGYTYTFPAVTANRTLTASTEIKHFTITKTAGANGTITGPATVDYGSNATYQIVPSDGYLVENVMVDGMSVGAVSTYTFHNVTADHTINATFKTEDCVLASNLQTINIDSTSATLTWYHPGADSYDIQYKMATASTWTVVSNVPGFAYDLTNLQSNTTYVWKVKANMASCTDADWSNANTFKTLVGPSTIGVADYVKEHVNVYAEHNRVHIVNDYAVEINNVTIYDMYGKMIYSGAVISNPEVIELNVAVGTYVVRLNTANGPAVYKVHINR